MSDTFKKPLGRNRGFYSVRMKPMAAYAGPYNRMMAEIRPGAFHRGEGYVPKGPHDKTQYTKCSPTMKLKLRNAKRAYQKRGRQALKQMTQQETEDHG